jgi:hypothetical protein
MVSGNQSLNSTFSVQVAKLPARQVRAKHCPVSGEQMMDAEMNPQGLTPRFLKQHVYESIVYRDDVSTCAMCGCGQDHAKVAGAQSQPREIKHHFCDKCFEYMCLVSAAVHGDSNALQLFAGAMPQIAYQPMQKLSDVIELHPQRQPLPVYAKR